YFVDTKHDVPEAVTLEMVGDHAQEHDVDEGRPASLLRSRVKDDGSRFTIDRVSDQETVVERRHQLTDFSEAYGVPDASVAATPPSASPACSQRSRRAAAGRHSPDVSLKRPPFGSELTVSRRKSYSSSACCSAEPEKYGAVSASDTGMRRGMPDRSRMPSVAC